MWFTLAALVGLAVVAWETGPKLKNCSKCNPKSLPNLVPTASNVNAALQETGGPLGVSIVEALTSTKPTPEGAAIGIASMTAAQSWIFSNPHFVGLPLPPVTCSPTNFGGQIMCERYYAGKGGNVKY